MLEAMTHLNLDAFTHYYSAGEVMGPFSRPSVSQSYVLECTDDKWIALHMSSPEKFWQGLAAGDRAPRDVRRTRASPRARRASRTRRRSSSVLSGVFATRTRTEWCNRLQAQDVPHAPMYDTDEAPAGSAGAPPAAAGAGDASDHGRVPDGAPAGQLRRRAVAVGAPAAHAGRAQRADRGHAARAERPMSLQVGLVVGSLRRDSMSRRLAQALQPTRASGPGVPPTRDRGAAALQRRPGRRGAAALDAPARGSAGKRCTAVRHSGIQPVHPRRGEERDRRRVQADRLATAGSASRPS